ncbi:MAG: hypothetical protein KDA91_24065 [Planctomycetaceae bacterium]|nr:hypothetical protein [Planctomycetaceae bacterium]
MTPTQLVNDLKRSSGETVNSLLQYLQNPPVPEPPEHLGEFTSFYRSLSQDQRQTLADLLTYIAEGSLFDLLGFLDNTATLPSSPASQLELWQVTDDQRTQLNGPDGPLLQDAFNL